MRSKERAVVFVIMALHLFSSYIAPSATPLPPVDSQGEKELIRAASEQLIINNKYDQGSVVTTAHQRKLAHGVNGGGVNGGGQPSGNTNGGGSGSPYAQGGGGKIPLYAAGAGNNRHPHHNGGNCHRSMVDRTILVVVILVACLLLHAHKEW